LHSHRCLAQHGGLVQAGDSLQPARVIDTGDQAPDFTLPALDELRYSLHEVVGDGPVVLAIWQAGCGACRLAAPYFNRLNHAFENISWSFLNVAQDVVAKAREVGE